MRTTGVVSKQVERVLTTQPAGNQPKALSAAQLAALNARVEEEKRENKEKLVSVARHGNPAKRKRTKHMRPSQRQSSQAGASQGASSQAGAPQGASSQPEATEGDGELGGDGEGEGLTADGF